MILKFRAKANLNNEWIYASNILKVILDDTNEELWVMYPKNKKIEHLGDGYIKCRPLVIDKKTIGQYTGFNDIHGEDIYSNSRVKYKGHEFEIQMELGSYCLCTNDHGLLYELCDDVDNDNAHPLYSIFIKQDCVDNMIIDDLEVISDIHENKDLL